MSHSNKLAYTVTRVARAGRPGAFAALVLAIVLLPAALRAAGDLSGLSERLSTFSEKVGSGSPTLEIRFGALDEVLNSPLEVVLSAPGPDAAERWRLLVAREDYVDRDYRFDNDPDSQTRVEEVAAAPSVRLDLGSQKRGSVYYLQAVRLRDGREVGRSPMAIRVPLLPARREALIPRPDFAGLETARTFREEIFRDFGFRPEAARHIRSTSAVEVLKLDSNSGGGGWAPWDRLVILDTRQREAAVHELAHVWWHDRRRGHPEERKQLARDVVRLADMDPKQFPEYAEQIRFARGYVNGIGDWKGMYCLGEARVANPRRLTDDDLEKRVNDWEIFAGFSSYTMGYLDRGPHRLPPFLARHFQRLFTGKAGVVPYYQGGPP